MKKSALFINRGMMISFVLIFALHADARKKKLTRHKAVASGRHTHVKVIKSPGALHQVSLDSLKDAKMKLKLESLKK
jgi:hypothetical protein